MQESHGQRLDAGRVTGLERRLERGLIERTMNRAVGEHALIDLDDLITRDERRMLVDEQVIDVVPKLTLDLEHVAKAAGGDQKGAGALALDDQVGPERGAVHDVLELARLSAGPRDRGRPDHGTRLRRGRAAW